MGPPMSWAFFFPLDHRGYEIGPNFVRFFLFLYRFLIFSFCYSLLILLSFFNFFSFIYSYSCLLIGSYSSHSSSSILRLLIFFLYLICLLHYTHTHELYTSASIRPYFCFLNFYFCSSLLILLFLFFSLQKTPRKFQFGKKNPPKYTTAYIVQ
jgi:hypothetical protein